MPAREASASPSFAADRSVSSGCRLLRDPPAEGAWNMAFDEALLESAGERGDVTLRFYEWAPATLSLGYFQQVAHRATHAASASCPVVRRQSGGGAILHDRELTYSLAVPAGHRLARTPVTLYDRVHTALVAALAELGVTAALHDCGAECRADPPFLCFQRRAAGDVLIGHDKIAGSAQRRRRGAILQHGSVLLAASPAAPELPGLAELGRVGETPDALLTRWLPHLARRLELSPEPGHSQAGEIDCARRLAAEKHASRAWINRR